MKPFVQVCIEARNAYTKFKTNLTASTSKRHGRHRISWLVQTHAVTDKSPTWQEAVGYKKEEKTQC